jgi:hypothetical protein
MVKSVCFPPLRSGWHHPIRETLLSPGWLATASWGVTCRFSHLADAFNPSPLSSKSSKTTATAITTTHEDFEDSGDGAPVLHFNQ